MMHDFAEKRMHGCLSTLITNISWYVGSGERLPVGDKWVGWRGQAVTDCISTRRV